MVAATGLKLWHQGQLQWYDFLLDLIKIYQLVQKLMGDRRTDRKVISSSSWLYSRIQALASPFGVSQQEPFYLEDQASVFMTPGDRVAQSYPQALGTHFSPLLRHAWVTVGLFFNPGHHMGG
jgi:hypothetical protein